MSTKQPHLERRPSGYYWRRRVPAAAKNRFKPEFFCFPLRTHVPREAAERARQLTAISEFCFNAEPDVSPDIMTNILETYASIAIETGDRMRALSGPRTREAGEAAMAIEAATRTSLRDAIFRCDTSPALEPIRDIAMRLGVTLDESEEDFGILADTMVRLMIEVSEEKERRARGHFAEPLPYLTSALGKIGDAASSTVSKPRVLADAPEAPVPGVPADIEVRETVDTATSSNSEAAQRPASEPSVAADGISIARRQEPKSEPEGSAMEKIVLYKSKNRAISLDPELLEPARILDGSDPRIVDLWDDWFADRSSGLRTEGAYIFEDEGKAKKFEKDSDTIRSTRNLVADIFGDLRLSEANWQHWKLFNDTLWLLPTNRGRSCNLRDLTCFEFIEHEKREEKKRIADARKQIKARQLTGDMADGLLLEAKTSTIGPRTFQRHQKYLSAPLDHAVSQGRISHNPFKPFVLGEKVIDEMRNSRPETARMTWTSQEFTKLLSSGKWASQKTHIEDHVYWVPLIARLHGMRSEEILQLKPQNIRCDDGIWFFDIERGTGQSIKSNNARRMVPIHSQIIELGFLKLVEIQRKKGERRVFSKVTRSSSKRLSYTANFTKNFTYYRKSRGVYVKRQDLHAMRTTFNTKCVSRSVPDTARRYLMGHRNEDVGIVNYLPEGFPLATLKDYIELEQLDLSMVTRRFGAAPEPTMNGPRLAVRDGVALSA